MPDITCPDCATVTLLPEVRRDADSFCPTCDYPLFWARTAALVGATGVASGAGLRRLPGTAGHSTEVSFACPVCREPNPVDGVLCIRCNSELRPAPIVVIPEPPPPPAPAPVVVAKRPWWPWALAALIVLIVLVTLTFVLFGNA